MDFLLLHPVVLADGACEAHGGLEFAALRVRKRFNLIAALAVFDRRMLALAVSSALKNWRQLLLVSLFVRVLATTGLQFIIII